MPPGGPPWGCPESRCAGGPVSDRSIRSLELAVELRLGENAEAVFRISFAQRSSAFSCRSRASSAADPPPSSFAPADPSERRSSASTQPRNVSGLRGGYPADPSCSAAKCTWKNHVKSRSRTPARRPVSSRSAAHWRSCWACSPSSGRSRWICTCRRWEGGQLDHPRGARAGRGCGAARRPRVQGRAPRPAMVRPVRSVGRTALGHWRARNFQPSMEDSASDPLLTT